MHPFFKEIENIPELAQWVRTDITNLPQPYKGHGKIKAILLGANPTNGGLHKGDDQIEFTTVFGLDSEYSEFFRPQLINLKEIKLGPENLYIQNVCRNYFREQTAKNKAWSKVAAIWVEYLKDELGTLDCNLPILVTAEKIMKVLVPDVPSARDLYSLKFTPPLFSQKFKRQVFPLYRHPAYMLKKYPEYRKLLTTFSDE